MSNKIVSVSGLIGSGKDTIGQWLVDEYGYTRMSFSSSIKDAVASIFGFDRQMLDGLTPESRAWRETVDDWWTEKLDLGRQMTPRDIIIEFATGLMRDKFHRDIWRLSLQRQIMQFDGPVVLTDTRHFNELALVREMGGTILGVWRHIPKWVKPFYEGVENCWLSDGESPFEANLQTRGDQSMMTNYGKLIMAEQEPRDKAGKLVHESEWQHLLWNDYDAVIDNSGTLERTFEQVWAHLIKT